MNDSREIAGGEDADALVRAIERAANELESASPTAARQAELARAIIAHVAHARSKVRQAVAYAALHLPDEAFETAITALLRDSNQWVKNAATQSYKKRSVRERIARAHEDRSSDILRLRARLDRKAVKIADEICDRTLGQFVEGFLHELAKVAMPLQAAIDDVRTRSRAGTADRLALADRADEARDMLKLLLSIADSARAYTQSRDPSYREENVRALVEAQLALLRARIGDARLARLRVDIDIDPSLGVEADPVLLSLALANVLENAVESHPPEGLAPIVVVVRAEPRKAGTLVAIAVQDRGRGIAKDYVASIGAPFVSTKGRGRGLGLLNVRKMVEVAHGGTVEIDSELGVGTSVVLVLPRTQSTRDLANRS